MSERQKHEAKSRRMSPVRPENCGNRSALLRRDSGYVTAAVRPAAMAALMANIQRRYIGQVRAALPGR